MRKLVLDQLDDLRYELDARTAAEVLRTASERFGAKLTMATGFGAEGCVLLDLIAKHDLEVDVFTLDTGLFFDETYELWRRLETRYQRRIRAVTSELDLPAQSQRFGDMLWKRDPDLCCRIRKVAPLERALEGYDAWVTAIRRDQTPDRANVGWLDRDRRYGLVKVSPLMSWTREAVWRYVREHDVPVSPLHARGYPSIGCTPCTSAVTPGEDPRAGRWRGRVKTECGLHHSGEKED